MLPGQHSTRRHPLLLELELPARRLHARVTREGSGMSGVRAARVPARLAQASDYHWDAIPSPKNVSIR
jgi:hypothetical protein